MRASGRYDGPVGAVHVSTLFVLALLAWLAVHRWRPGWRWVRRGLLALSVGLGILIYPFTNNLLAGWLEYPFDPDRDCWAAAPAAIIVLPAGLRRQPRGSGPWSRMTPATTVRALEAASLARTHPDALLVFAGRHWEAVLFQRGMIALGLIDKNRIVLDRQSPSTDAAARRVGELLAERGLDSAWLVTSALHIRRAMLSFERQGIAVCPYPVDYTAQPGPRPWWIFPPPQALERADRVVHEILGLLWYWATDRV